jgi:hypothetical protein
MLHNASRSHIISLFTIVALMTLARVRFISYTENKTRILGIEPSVAPGHQVPRTTIGPPIYLGEPESMATAYDGEPALAEEVGGMRAPESLTVH